MSVGMVDRFLVERGRDRHGACWGEEGHLEWETPSMKIFRELCDYRL